MSQMVDITYQDMLTLLQNLPYKNNIGLFSKSKEDWINNLEELINNKELRLQLGQSAYTDIKENYNLEKVAKRYNDMLKGLINKGVSV